MRYARFTTALGAIIYLPAGAFYPKIINDKIILVNKYERLHYYPLKDPPSAIDDVIDRLDRAEDYADKQRRGEL